VNSVSLSGSLKRNSAFFFPLFLERRHVSGTGSADSLRIVAVGYRKMARVSVEQANNRCMQFIKKKKKRRGLSPRANYTD
jgi:hypothetical protein